MYCEPCKDYLLYALCPGPGGGQHVGSASPWTEKIGEQADWAGSQAVPDSTFGSISSGPGQIAYVCIF